MKRGAVCIAAALAVSMSVAGASAQTKSGLDKLYILNCGEGVAGDISRWSPGVNVGKSMDFVDNCYLMHHTQGWLLWDTGVADAIAAMPDGQAPADPRMTRWRRPKTLASQLEALGVKPELPQTGALVLSGDAVHFKGNWENRGVPSNNTDKEKTLASMQRIADVLAKEKAQLWINHDKAQRDSLKMAPAFYE
jgi:hypothetical protein